jgi:hypothetical protein
VYNKNEFTFSLGLKFDILSTIFRIAIVYIGELFCGIGIASTKHVLRQIGLTILKNKINKKKMKLRKNAIHHLNVLLRAI